jgi:cysteine desulfuration protein SufE
VPDYVSIYKFLTDVSTPPLTIQQTQERIIKEFNLFHDWTDRYEHIINLGKKLPAIDEVHRSEENKVHGCQSQVWLHATRDDGIVRFQADSDALIVKGLIALLLRVYNGRTPSEILLTDPYFITKIGLDRHLSPTRANGLGAMLKKIKLYAAQLESLT